MALADNVANWARNLGREFRGSGDLWAKQSGTALRTALDHFTWAKVQQVDTGSLQSPAADVDPYQRITAGNPVHAGFMKLVVAVAGAAATITRYTHSAWGQTYQRFDQAFRPALAPPEQIIDGYRRGIYPHDVARDLLSKHGLTDQMISVYLDQKDYLPTPADLVSFAVREAYEPDQVRLLGLDSDVQDVWAQVAPTAAKNGLTFDTWQLFWRAHWQPLTVGQAIELHRRYPDRYNLDWVKAIAKANEVVPNQVPALLDLTEDLLTLVNIQRAYELGIYSDADVFREGKRRGLSDADAEVFRKVAVGIREGQLASTRRARADITKPQYEQAYRDGVFTRAELDQAYAALGYDLAERQLLAELQDAQLLRESRAARVRALRTLYLRKIWDVAQVTSELREVGIQPEAITRYLETWDMERLGDGPSPDDLAQRDLTKTELLDAYQNRILETDDVTTGLRSLGYDEAEVSTLIALADAKMRRAEATAVEQSIHDAYVAGQISRIDAVVALDGINVPTTRRDALLRRWDVEALRRGQQFTVAQIEKLARASLIDDARAKRELTRIKYTDEQADLLLQLWGATEQPPGFE